jgi:enoyl-CoA hydratase
MGATMAGSAGEAEAGVRRASGAAPSAVQLAHGAEGAAPEGGTPAVVEAPVLYEKRGAAAWLTLNRPHRLNAVNQAMYEALVSAVRAAEHDEEVRVVLVTGSGRAFCSGADLQAHAESELTRKDRRRYARSAQDANLALQRCAKPVVAAVNGHAVGAGLELALSCDFIIVASEAKLRFPELALGTFVGGGVTYTLPERVGVTRAKELLLLGDFFSGDSAAAMGLANRCVPGGEVIRVATALAERLAMQAPVPMALARRLLRRSRRLGRRAAALAETRALVQCMGTEDWKEGLRAFSEKRAPRYTGR